MKPPLDTSVFRHYTRVRIGATGPKGRLLRCEKRDGSGSYWKVKLDSGEWVWPDDRMLIDGPGERIARCGDCELPFLTDGSSPLCPLCNEEAFGTRRRQVKPEPTRSIRASLSGNRSGVKAPRSHTPEELAAAAHQRQRDDEQTPF